MQLSNVGKSCQGSYQLRASNHSNLLRLWAGRVMGAGRALGSFVRGQENRIFAFVWFLANIVGNSFLDGGWALGYASTRCWSFPGASLLSRILSQIFFCKSLGDWYARSLIIDITSFLLVVIQTCIGAQ